MMLKPGQQTITRNILPHTSRSKGNQTMKFGQLIEYKKRNNFLQKSCVNIIKCGESWWSIKIAIDFALLRVIPHHQPFQYTISSWIAINCK